MNCFKTRRLETSPSALRKKFRNKSDIKNHGNFCSAHQHFWRTLQGKGLVTSLQDLSHYSTFYSDTKDKIISITAINDNNDVKNIFIGVGDDNNDNKNEVVGESSKKGTKSSSFVLSNENAIIIGSTIGGVVFLVIIVAIIFIILNKRFVCFYDDIK